MLAPNEITDWGKVDEIEASLRENGWVGAPLVEIDGSGELVTGSHRIEAWRRIYDTDYGIPTIDLSDVFAESGLDLASVMAEEGCEYIGDSATLYVFDRLSADVIATYGIDWS